MSVADDIKKNSADTFGRKWIVRDGQVVPDASDLKLSNDAVRFEKATVLYADLDQSTKLVEKKKWEFAGEVYKTFLYAASRLIRHHGGTIVSYDGDRVMGVFISNRQRNDAVSCALKINYAVKNYVQAEMEKRWTGDFQIRHVIGIDTSEIRAARTGVRGDNDLVWIGTAETSLPNLHHLALTSRPGSRSVYTTTSMMHRSSVPKARTSGVAGNGRSITTRKSIPRPIGVNSGERIDRPVSG
jgi:class 3 adenylate cyclase